MSPRLDIHHFEHRKQFLLKPRLFFFLLLPPIEFGLQLPLPESLRLGPQHVRQLLLGHPQLLPYRHQTPRQFHIVFSQQRDRHHQVVNVVEDEGRASGVLRLGLEESAWVIAPMAQRIQVVRGMVAVIEAVAVALTDSKLALESTIGKGSENREERIKSRRGK